MTMNKTIMILGASILQLPAIEKAIDMGLKVVVLDMNPKAIGFSVPGVIKEVISTIDIPSAVEAAKRHKIDGIMTLATDMPMRTVAVIAKECGLVGISEDTSIKATDKGVMRQALKEAGVPIPYFFIVENIDDYKIAAAQMKSAFMVKPADSSGSRGVVKVDSAEMSEDAYEYAKSFSRNGIVVVEECMEGPEVSVETLAINGTVHVIQITDKITTGAPHFVEMGHTQPTRLKCGDEIKRIAIAANKAIGIQNGPSHTEIIVTDEGPKIVEIGARLGGDCITTHLVPLSTGINMVECCIKIALGLEPDIEIKYSKGSAIRYFAQHKGIVKKIIGVEKAWMIDGVKEVHLSVSENEKVSEVNDSSSRIGFVVAQGIDSHDAVLNCIRAMNCIEIDIGE